MKHSLSKIAEFIFQNDRLFRFLDAVITDFGEGYAQVEMTVKEEHLNAAEVCQGGVLFTLADLAFALASNSYGTIALAIKSSITYVKSAKLGDRLIARASEFCRSKSLATYLVVITRADGEKIAFFEGTVYRFDKPVLKEFEVKIVEEANANSHN